MPDRSLRLLTFPPQQVLGGKRGSVLLRERPASPPDAPSGREGDDRGDAPKDDNPFAPPPEGTPDSPWRPRHHPSGSGSQSDDQGSGGPHGGSGGSSGGDGSQSGSPWGSQWSDRQPGRSGGGFGERPGGGPEGPGNTPGPNLRWDPTDPAQRRARYALLSGMWAFFFALFSWPYVALLLGALALYWGISALRASAAAPPAAQSATPATPPPPAAPPAGQRRPQTTAAVSGIVTAALALVLVAANFTAQLVYSDYYTCVNDALTNEAKQSCNDHLPKELRNFLGTTD